MSKNNSIVLELQTNAVDPDWSVTSLLRKSLMIAKKLGLEEFEEWISNELNGLHFGSS